MHSVVSIDGLEGETDDGLSRRAALLIGSGGVLRADPPAGLALLTDALVVARGTGRMLPEHPDTVIDADYRLVPIDLIAEHDIRLAAELAMPLG